MSESRHVQLRRLATCTLGKMVQPFPTEGSVQAPYLRAAHVQPGGRLIDLPDQQMWFTNQELRTLTLRRDDVVIVEGGAGYGRSAVLREDLNGWGFQNSIVRVRPIRARSEGRFLDYAIQAALRSGQIDSFVSTATIPHFTAEKVARLPIVGLAVEQQRAVADFLDRETAQIDAFIAKNEELITLLTERRSAVVADGIVGSATSDRGEKLEYSCRVGNGSTPRRDEALYWGGGDFPWLNSSVVNQDRVRSADQFVTRVARAECHLPSVAPGAIVVGLTGEGRTRGMATIVDIKATINQHLAYIQPDVRRWVPEYLLWLLRSRYRWLRDVSDANGATKGGLTVEQLRSMRVTRPSLPEQRRLVSEIESQTAAISHAVDVAARGVALAWERRAALISAAVAGKIYLGVVA